MAHDHQAWALHLQEKTQALIQPYRQEGFGFKKQKGRTKGCRVRQSLTCSKTASVQPIAKDADLFIFVSFSLPKETLKALAREAKTHQGVLVIRGLMEKSFVKTAAFLQELKVEMVLDPTLFKEYDVQVVPTFVRKHKNAFMRLCGHVSLAYALSKFKEETDKEESDEEKRGKSETDKEETQ